MWKEKIPIKRILKFLITRILVPLEDKILQIKGFGEHLSGIGSWT